MRSAELDPAVAARALASRLRGKPEVLVVLGSGLSVSPDDVEMPVDVRFDALPGLPAAGVVGHPGRFLAGRLEGRDVLFQRGRFHFYEGHDADVVAAPIRVAAALGIEIVILTNASGGIHPAFEPGTLVLVEDHVNLQARSPLTGPGLGKRGRTGPGLGKEARHPDVSAPDVSAPYDRALAEAAERVARDLRIPLMRGTYGAVLGPNFETPAEIRMLRRLGADVVGMSTVPEVIVARALGMRVLVISVVVNPAAGLHADPLSHDDVIESSRAAAVPLLRLVRGVLARLPSGKGADRAGAPKAAPPNAAPPKADS